MAESQHRQAARARIVFATRNRGKVTELAELIADTGVELLSLADLPDAPEVVEDGDTFEANAIKKAREIAAWSGMIAIADDSGLEVDALGGAPGIRSARFAGEHATDAENREKLLRLMAGVPLERRTGRFVAAIAVALPDGQVSTVRGVSEGVIGTVPRGNDGFGYDPLFVAPEYGKTYAELDLATKNRLSHRGRAFRLARPAILTAVEEKGMQ